MTLSSPSGWLDQCWLQAGARGLLLALAAQEMKGGTCPGIRAARLPARSTRAGDASEASNGTTDLRQRPQDQAHEARGPEDLRQRQMSRD